MPLMYGGQQIPHNEVPRNAEVEIWAPEQQMATYGQLNSTLANTAINGTEQRHLGTLHTRLNANGKIRWRKQA
jgi:hypothetical protein